MGVERICSGVEGGGIEHVRVGVEHVHVGVEHVRMGVERVRMGVERVRAGVECVRAGVEGGGIEGTREWANMGWEFQSETRENYVVYIPRMPMNGRGRKKSPPTHI